METNECEHATPYVSSPAGRFGTSMVDNSITVCKKGSPCAEQIPMDNNVFCKKSPILDRVRK